MRKGGHVFIHTIKNQYNATLVTNPEMGGTMCPNGVDKEVK